MSALWLVREDSCLEHLHSFPSFTKPSFDPTCLTKDFPQGMVEDSQQVSIRGATAMMGYFYFLEGMDRNGEFYHLPPSKDVQGVQRQLSTPWWLLRAFPSSLGNTLCYLQAVIDSSSLIKQKQQDSFLLKGQATIIFQKWILPAFTEDKHSSPCKS